MESMPLYIILSSVILLLTASILYPAYCEWQDSMQGVRARAEAEKIFSAADMVRLLGDVGSVQQVRVSIPEKHLIGFTEDSVVIFRESILFAEYSLDARLRYSGSRNLSGPGEYLLTVVYWTENDTTNEGKEFLLEVVDP